MLQVGAAFSWVTVSVQQDMEVISIYVCWGKKAHVALIAAVKFVSLSVLWKSRSV